MNAIRLGLLIVLTFWLAADALSAQGADIPPSAITSDQERFFEEKVRPLLANKCVDCHGPDKQESGLRLDSRQAVLTGGDSGEPAVVSGHPEESRLLKAVRREGDYKMPPSDRERLLPAEIDTLATWIKLGLPWGQGPQTVEVSMEERYQQARRTHWAFQPIQRMPLAGVVNTSWLVNSVDTFVLAKLEAAGMTPSPPADRRTLIRRATYDLIGLPPTPQEVEAFASTSAPDAYERLIDRLLASPHHGERWGRHWLDVARYADTRGYAFQKEPNFPYAYTYRDYVVRSFNEDLPYDQFVVEQLAADQLPSGSDNRRLAALGYLTVGRKYLSRNDDFDDQVDVVTRGMLGLTVACARCHDHKYDAIPTEDYYSLFGIFSNCRQPDDLPYLGDPTAAPGYATFQAELEQLKKAMQDFVVERRNAAVDSARTHVTDYLVRVVSTLPETELEKLPFIKLKGDDNVKTKVVERWTEFLSARTPEDPVFGPWRELSKLPVEQFSQQAPAILARWDAVASGLETGRIHPWVKTALATSPPQSRIDLAQLYGKLLEDAYAQWQASATTTSSAASTETLARLSSEAAALARVLVDDTSPTNLDVNEPRDFLTRADRNKQAELKKKVDGHEVRSPHAPPRAMILADNTRISPARVLLRGNQNRPGKEVPRQFVRLVVGDQRQPFRQGSGRWELAQAIVAPDNPLTARVIANRLWMHHFDAPLVTTPSDFGIRSDPPSHPQLLDYLAARLLTNGWLLKDLHRQIMTSNTYRQASSNRPECKAADPENRLLWRMNRRRLEFEPLRDSLLVIAGRLDSSIGGRAGDVTSPSFLRRAVYGKVDRQDLPNLLRVFDFASPDQSSPGRSRTTVPQQALFLLNSPFAIEQAQGLAARPEVAAAESDAAKIAALYHLVFTRPPTAEELSLGQTFFAMAAPQDAAKVSPLEQYAQLLLLTNEVMYVD
jgi:mono/diheme cytochrome c family protein